MADPAIVVEDLGKTFGDVRALQGVNFTVAPGTLLGVLGPNGAGKTTAVRILSTLVRPESGRALVHGYDVVTQASAVRERIGLAGQFAAIQDDLTCRENLEILARLLHYTPAAARRRADELLELFELTDRSAAQAKTLSGGLQRRLDLAGSLVGRPRLLFLDEPTTGLDPRSRRGLWELVQRLVAEGTTVLLTTQYLDEVDALADDIVVFDRGTVVATGTPATLRDRLGGDVLDLEVGDRSATGRAAAALRGLSEAEPAADDALGRVTLRVPVGGSQSMVEAVRRLDSEGIVISQMALHSPSLDDVLIALTDRDPDSVAGVDGRPVGGS